MTSSTSMDYVLFVLFCVIIVFQLSQRRTSATSHDSGSTNLAGNPQSAATGPRSASLHSSASKSKKCFRVSNIPASWDASHLRTWLQQLDERWEPSTCIISLYPSCYNTHQTALVNMDNYPQCFKDIKPDEDKVLEAPEGAMLSVDYHFHDLTPLNIPDPDITADVIAVAGHAFGSWRNHNSQQMWLQDFLPFDVRGVRVMTYGYDTNLASTIDNSSILDLRRAFVQQLENARCFPAAKHRPIIFIGHSLGGILILQALIQASNTPQHKHLLDATRAFFLFGTPHQGLRTKELEAMVDDLSGGVETARLKLLAQLKEGSEYLETQQESLATIWNERKVFSFYETRSTPTVQKSSQGHYERTGDMAEMVKKVSAQLFLSNEQRIPIHQNHTELVKFAHKGDTTYLTLLKHLRSCLDEINIHGGM
ncbi:hypothetical protein FN846DRAFT_801292 [Sphaerosporella brunnea]|uniref:Alpha/Beta hydrolase protein n=1 Tax=Sphaerosporella brunnea TaxID=1250544 RepID=A0A5J5EKX7_9PEZI|nr:hypothetical protein FN846DRAFT_801292 [Sphaerosporella brunnea]